MLDKRNFYINGKWVAPSKPNDFNVIDPSNEKSFAVISLGDAADTNAAVKAAKSWSSENRFGYLINDSSLGIEVLTSNGSWRTIQYS